MRGKGAGLKIADISRKKVSSRNSIARGMIKLRPDTMKMVRVGTVPKGDVLTIAKVSAVLAVKRTSEIIPGCHSIPIDGIEVDYEMEDDKVIVTCEVKTESKTGVEMEAITGTCVALLTIWDMVKELEKDEKGQYPTTSIGDIRVLKKVKV